MKKLNRKGFALAETLVVTAFVAVIFTILFTNITPLLGTYEQLENYDDLDSKYATFWIKTMIQNPHFETSKLTTALQTNNYYQFKCSDLDNSQNQELCNHLIKNLEVASDSSNMPKIYIVYYNTTGIKDFVARTASNEFDRGLTEYIDYLPKYQTVSQNGANYRVIVEYHRVTDENDDYVYSNMEVIK